MNHTGCSELVYCMHVLHCIRRNIHCIIYTVHCINCTVLQEKIHLKKLNEIPTV